MREVAEPVTSVLPAPVQTVVATVQETARTVDQTVTDVLGPLGFVKKIRSVGVSP